ncbi:MAG: FtsX-like permease family protein [Bacteroidota bacterium]
MLKSYFIIAFRNIRKYKIISFINVFGLTVSMSVCLILLTIIMDQLAYDNFHADKDRIYRAITTRTHQAGDVWETATIPYPLTDEIEAISGVERLTRIRSGFGGVATTEDAEIPFNGFFTDNHFLKIFNFPLKYGNVEKALEIPNSIVLTQALSYKLFGDEVPMDKVIKVGEMGDFIVTGVLEEMPGKSHLNFEALTSVQLLAALEEQNIISPGIDTWGNVYNSYAYFVMQPGTDIGALKEAFERGTQSYNPDDKFSYAFSAQSLNDITPGRQLSNEPGFSLPSFIIYFFAILALIVLIAATFNYANLSTARALNRAKEIGVRKVAGARRHHIIGQFLVEAVIIALISLFLADFITDALQMQLNSYLQALDAPFTIDTAPSLVFIFVAFAVAAGLIAGLVPALFFSNTKTLQALKKNVNLSQLSGRSSRLNFRKVLMVIQFSFSVFFVLTVTTIYRQSQLVLYSDYGYDVEGIVALPLNGLKADQLKNEIDQLAAVKGTSFVSHLPSLGRNITFPVKGSLDGEAFSLSYFSVDQNYLSSLNIDLLHGQNFEGAPPKSESEIIINETAAKKLGFEQAVQALGEEVIYGWEATPGDSSNTARSLKIIGIVADHHFERLDRKIEPMALRRIPSSYDFLVLNIDNENMLATMPTVGKIWSQHTNRPFEYQLFTDEFWKSNGIFDLVGSILAYVTLITVSISCLGLLGMVIFNIQNKVKEIGLRKVLGANEWNIIYNVSRGFVILMIISFVVGTPLAYLVNNAFLESYEYRVSFGFETILIGFLTIMATAFVVMGPQVYRASRLNPADTLKDE